MGFDKTKIGFSTILTGLTAFIADFEKHLHHILDDNSIPVYFHNTGDETYYDARFEVIGDTNEIYKSVPRVVFKIDSIDTETETESNKNITSIYVHDNKIYSGQLAKHSIEIPLICNFVASNFIWGMQYFELILTMFNSQNVFTYNYMNNNYDGQYSCKSYTFEFPTTTANSENKFFITNFNTKLQLPIYIADYKTIKQLNPSNGLPIELKGNELTQLRIDDNGYLVNQHDLNIIQGGGSQIKINLPIDNDGNLLDTDNQLILTDVDKPINLLPIKISTDGKLINKYDRVLTNENNELLDGKGNVLINMATNNPIIIKPFFNDNGNLLDVNDNIINGLISDTGDADDLEHKEILLKDINNVFDASRFSPFKMNLISSQTEWDKYKTQIQNNTN